MSDNGSSNNKGKLFLIGFGPGDHDHLTFRAKAAIGEAAVVIGYRTYIDLVKELTVGKQSSTSTMRMRNESIQPPRYPEMRPMIVPKKVAIDTATKPTESEIRAP